MLTTISTLRRCLSEALGPSMKVRVHYVSLEEIDKEPSGKRPVAILQVPRGTVDSGFG